MENNIKQETCQLGILYLVIFSFKDKHKILKSFQLCKRWENFYQRILVWKVKVLVARLCLTLCNPTNCNRPGFPVLHCFLEFAQTHVHWVSDAIQPSRPLSSLSPPALNLSQNESFPVSLFFASGGQSIWALASASVLLMNIQGWFPLGLTGLISLLSKGLLRVFSNTTIRKHQFFGTQPSLWSSSHIHTWLLEKPWLWLDGPLSAKWCLYFLIGCLGWS